MVIRATAVRAVCSRHKTHGKISNTCAVFLFVCLFPNMFVCVSVCAKVICVHVFFLSTGLNDSMINERVSVPSACSVQSVCVCDSGCLR